MPSVTVRAEAVVAVAEVDAVIALAAGDHVRVRAAAQRVGGVRAVDDVRARAAVERQRDPLADGSIGADEVDAAAAEDRQAVVWWRARSRSDDRGPEPSTRTVSMNGRIADVVEAVAALDVDLRRARRPAARGRCRRCSTAESLRSPMSIRSCPPAAPTSSVSTAVLSVVAGWAGADSRAIRALPSKACSVNSSESEDPAANSRSFPLWPSTVSNPSPPEHGVVARAEDDGVVAAAGRHLVAVVAGRDQLGAGPADHGVGARAGGDRRRLGQGVGDLDGVVAGARADVDLRERRAVEARPVDLERGGRGRGAA